MTAPYHNFFTFSKSIKTPCIVLRNRKLFMIYWSRHLGWNVGSQGCIYFDMLCKELIKRGELYNIC